MFQGTDVKYFDHAVTDGHIKLQGDGRTERIIYVADNNHTERWSDPEEKVRAAFYAELIYRYGYSAARIGVEITVPRRTPSDRADLVVYADDDRKDPFIVIECKRDGVSDAEFNQAIEQSCGNRASLSAKYAATVAGATRRFLDFRNAPNLERETNIVSDLPVSYGEPPKWRFYKGQLNSDIHIVSRDDLRTAIRKCHQTLWEGGRRSPITAFGEFSKIIFIKIRDEIETEEDAPYTFQRKTKELSEELGKRIRALYGKEQKREPDVFPELLAVDDIILGTVVDHLESINLNQTDLDTKGVAFEEFLGGFFKGDFGQYFTPRELVAFAVHMLPPSADDLVLDPACGSGGFLLHALDYIRGVASQRYPRYETDAHQATSHYKYWHDFAEKHLFGIEINEELARVAKMNMIIHDDGHTNIVGEDALRLMTELNRKKPALQERGFDLVLTNPPFGAVIKKEEKGESYLAQYELRSAVSKSTTERDIAETDMAEGSAKRGAKVVKARTSVKTEILFLERVFQFLKPDGRAAIIVPDGILTNSSLQGVRNWLMSHYQILAVVSVPQFAFAHYDAGVKASILFLRRYQDNETPSDDEAIFMAQAENIGYDATGRDTFQKTLETETLGEKRIEIWHCDLFDYRVIFEWSTADPKDHRWSERGRTVIANSGLLGQYNEFQRNPDPFFV